MAKHKRTHAVTAPKRKNNLTIELTRKDAPTGHAPTRGTLVMRDKRVRREKDRLRKDLRDY